MLRRRQAWPSMPAVRHLLPLLPLALIVSLVAVACRPREGPTLPSPAPMEPSIAAQLHEIRDQASRLRELAPNGKVVEGSADREALADYFEHLREQTSETARRETKALTAALRLLHMIGPNDEFPVGLPAPPAPSAPGIYLFEDDALLLLAEPTALSDASSQSALAHEYIHSFQDARFDLEGLERLKEKDSGGHSEYQVTVQALIEGDAFLGQALYLEGTFGPGSRQEWLNSPSGPASPEGQDYAPAVRGYLDFPFDHGMEFVEFLSSRGGWEAVNKAYENPPVTTEQVLHPEKYLEGEAALPLRLRDISAILGTFWKRVTTRAFGEFDVYNYLMTALEDEERAARAAAGWGGGSLVVYSDRSPGDRVLVHLELIWDSTKDSEEFYQAYLELLDKATGGDIESEPGRRRVRWDLDGEHGYARMEGLSFRAVVAADDEDLEKILTAMP